MTLSSLRSFEKVSPLTQYTQYTHCCHNHYYTDEPAHKPSHIRSSPKPHTYWSRYADRRSETPDPYMIYNI